MAKVTDKDFAGVLKLARSSKGVTKAQLAKQVKSATRANYLINLLRKQRRLTALDLKTFLKPGALGKAARTKVFVTPGHAKLAKKAKKAKK
jgi:hypothetical protein